MVGNERMLFEAPLQPGFYLFGMVTEGAGLAFVDDRPGLVDDVQPFGPTGVNGVGAIVDGVDEEGIR